MDQVSLFLVAVTGWGQDEDRLQSRAHGFDAHLTQPADPDILLKTIATAPQAEALPGR